MPTTERVTAKEEPTTTTPAPRFLPLVTIPIRLDGTDVPQGGGIFGVMSNMSATGACVITNGTLPKDAAVRLTLSGQNGAQTSIDARVVWCAERMEPVKEIVGFLTGVCFQTADDDPDVRQLLESGIFQLVP